MYRTRLKVDKEPIIEARRFVNKFDSVVDGTAQDAFKDVQPEFLDALRYTPGPSKNGRNSDQPFRWSDDPIKDARGRAGFFARFPNGRERTGAMNEAWDVLLERVGRGFHVIAQNPVNYLKWVVGTFDQRRNYQIPGHARTGWHLVRETTSTFFDRFYTSFKERLDESIPRAWGGVNTRRRNR